MRDARTSAVKQHTSPVYGIIVVTEFGQHRRRYAKHHIMRPIPSREDDPDRGILHTDMTRRPRHQRNSDIPVAQSGTKTDCSRIIIQRIEQFVSIVRHPQFPDSVAVTSRRHVGHTG